MSPAINCLQTASIQTKIKKDVFATSFFPLPYR